ncbi:MAG TPA: ABC transporter substrate-binding protein [Burkholderiales bacterium]|nr:ABC transporter substrate-binding protein [Burkholderiales bacterium]
MHKKFAALVVSLFALASAARATEPQPITICALPFVSSAPLFIAQDKGYFAQQGLKAEIKIFHAAQPVAVGVAAGDCDFGVTGFTAGFFNLAGKGALKVIGAQSREQPGYHFVGFLVSNKAYNAGFHNIKQLPGHTVGISQIGSTFYYNVGMLADKFGWNLDSIHMKPLQSVPNMIAALKGGEVDIVFLPAHIVAALTKAKAGHLIGWVDDYTPWQLGGLFTSTKNIEQHAGEVRAFVRAYQKAATEYYAAFDQRDAKGERVFGDKAKALLPIIEKYTQSKPDAIYLGAPYIDPKGRLDVKDVYKQVAWYKKHGLVDQDVDPKKFLDLRFIKGQK